MSGHVNESMDKDSIMDSEDRIEKEVDIYVSAEAVRDMKHKKDKEDFDDIQTTKTQTPQCTASDSARNRSSRASVVCLVLLCVLLLTAVIVLCVIFMQEKQQLISKNENLTSNNKHLISKNENLTNERDQLTLKNTNLINKTEQLRNELQCCDGWIYYQFSLYYMSNVTKTWNESRQDCLKRGADLIIINNSEEQNFVHNISAEVWIGLNDIDVEKAWKWVDGTNVTFSFWGSKEPNGQKEDNCVVTLSIPPKDWPVGWGDVSCITNYRWICEKRISQLTLP
ncbi:hypothetical protein Q8A67_023732 [Cirrhinus molitorella]|uniref:C-type lectin domain-containing protein n=1 Tax=Cirrhinus molitorella TaxID=172907 RepID=A0AA88TAG6_9TELE|nr:hypothetical protein Q8A67_023732 [Cirrhinus molitorella]